MAEDAAAVAKRLAARAAERAPGEVRPWDDDAPVAARAHAHLADPDARLWIVSPSKSAARTWAVDAKLPGSRIGLVQRSTNLYDLGPGAFIVVLPGADLHPEWRAIAKQLNHIRQRDGLVVVVDQIEDIEYVGGIDIEPGSRLRPRPAQPGQGDGLVISSDGRAIAHLDRTAAEQLRRIVDAFLKGEPMPDPAREAAERIRREIEETGDLYGRGAEEE